MLANNKKRRVNQLRIVKVNIKKWDLGKQLINNNLIMMIIKIIKINKKRKLNNQQILKVNIKKLDLEKQ